MTYRPQITDRASYTKHAAPESIAANLAKATEAQVQATREVAWLSQLLAERQRQVAAGEWPPQPRTEVLSIRLADDELADLDTYAAARGLSRSEALRRIIADLLDAHPAQRKP